MTSCELDARAAVFTHLEQVQIAQVLRVTAHPNADRLQVCHVKAAETGTPLEIVCGAPNVREQMWAALAPLGAKLPAVEIRKAKIRGVESCGMLCSASELALSDFIAALSGADNTAAQDWDAGILDIGAFFALLRAAFRCAFII